MKTYPRILVVTACALSLLGGAGCSKRDAPSATSVAASPSPVSAPAVGNAQGAPKSDAPRAAGRALIVTEDMSLSVRNIDDAASQLRGAVERAGGYISDGNTSGKGDDRTATFELRVPTDKIADLHRALAGVGDVISDNEKVQDVTEERADLKARLHNARVQEKRVLEIMTAKTGTIVEVIDAERELARIRETIERLEAQERSLDGKIDLATIHVALRLPAPIAKPPVEVWQTPGKSITSAGEAGLHAAAAFYTYAAMTFVAVAPTLTPFAMIGAFIVVMVRRRRRGDAVLAAAAR